MNTIPPFRSDNTAGASPSVLEAISRINEGLATAYGGDALSMALDDAMSDLFERRCWCFPVGTGTAANAVALAATASGESLVACHSNAHILRNEDEAVRFFAPAVSFAGLPGDAGRIRSDGLAELAKGQAANRIHWSALSLTQLTEAGTLYSLDDLVSLSALAHRSGALVHMDGARFANAVVSLGCKPSEASWRAGVDILSFGATKNGTINADAIVVFDKAAAKSVLGLLKRSGQLYSKMRFMAAQLLAYLQDGLWLRSAAHANQMARFLRDRLQDFASVDILFPVDGNQIFVRLTDPLTRRLQQSGSLPWRSGEDEEGRPVYRLVTSFATTISQVDSFSAVLA